MGNLREVRICGGFRNVGRGRRTTAGRRTDYYGKRKEWRHVANWRKEEQRVDSRLLAEDEIAEMGEGGVVQNVGEEGDNWIALTRSLVGRMGKSGGDLGLGGCVRSGCGTEA